MKYQSNHHKSTVNKSTVKQSTGGMSLLEMSIVLMIIAALVAGVLVARSLRTTAELQTVITDADNYIKAIDNFKQAYGALPGDLTNATTLWGTDSSGCPSGGGSTGTCNGNGDGKVGSYCSSGSIDTTYVYEGFRVWQHLYSANLILTSLSGVGTTYLFTPGVNAPKASIQGAGFSLMWFDDPALCSNYFGFIPSTGRYGNVLILASGNVTNFPLTPAQAAEIDSKIDDGLPGTGTVRSAYSSTPNCLINTSGYQYNLTYTSKVCALMFLTNF
jgi:type II secretory pathway pseudopilin PulG